MEDKISKYGDLLVQWLVVHGIKILIIAVAAWVLNKLIKRLITKAVRIAVVSDANLSHEAEKKREDTLIRIFTGGTRIVIIILATLMILEEGGVKIGPVLAGAGIVGLAFGFGGQYLIKDLISGLFIILENQYRIGDVVNIDATGGLVEGISLRMTTLRDLDGTVHHIPHGVIQKVSNLSKGWARVNLDIGVSYDSDLEHVIEVVNKLGEEMAELAPL